MSSAARPARARGLTPLLARADVHAIQCRVPVDLLKARALRRGTAQPNREFRPDGTFLAELEQGQVVLQDWDMRALGRACLDVDSSEGYQPGLEDIAEFARR